jgi:ubiquinone/menaquinone biosynthesis C-methylase UbiE
MAWLLAPLYDRLVAPSEEACFRAWRTELLSDLSGQVLEIGAGTGANVERYPAAVGVVTFTEPDPGMRRQLIERLDAARAAGSFAPGDATVTPDRSERLPFADESFDAVVATLVLCTVPDPGATLTEIRRVLRPEGRLVFLEHVAAEDRPSRLRWQQRIDPLWKRVVGGCRLTRRTADTIEAAGFRFDAITRESARKATPLVRPTIRGAAVKT